MNPQPKEKLYRTAWSPLYGTYVSIAHAHTDDRGAWIFKCDGPPLSECNGHLFRAHELTDFCL